MTHLQLLTTTHNCIDPHATVWHLAYASAVISGIMFAALRITNYIISSSFISAVHATAGRWPPQLYIILYYYYIMLYYYIGILLTLLPYKVVLTVLCLLTNYCAMLGQSWAKER